MIDSDKNDGYKIYDAFMYFNEKDLLVARLKYLWDVVDYFVIVESNHSFSGIKKGYSCANVLESEFPGFQKKVYVYHNDVYIKSEELKSLDLGHVDEICNQVPLARFLIDNIKYYGGYQQNWINDFFQRELLLCALIELNPLDDDLILISDIDEIPSLPSVISVSKKHNKEVHYFEMLESKHYINYISGDLWIGTIGCQMENLAEFGVNHARFYTKRNGVKDCIIEKNAGWHFTSMGGVVEIITKIENWSHQEFNNWITKAMVPIRLKRGVDVFGVYDD